MVENRSQEFDFEIYILLVLFFLLSFFFIKFFFRELSFKSEGKVKMFPDKEKLRICYHTFFRKKDPIVNVLDIRMKDKQINW